VYAGIVILVLPTTSLQVLESSEYLYELDRLPLFKRLCLITHLISENHQPPTSGLCPCHPSSCFDVFYFNSFIPLIHYCLDIFPRYKSGCPPTRIFRVNADECALILLLRAQT